MYLNQKVKIPSDKNGVSVKKIKGVSYVYYAYDRVYNKEKKYTVPKNTTIGKGVPGEKGMMFPNQNYFRYFPEETNLESILPAAPRCEYLKVGTYFVLKKIISEYHLDEMAERIIGKDSGLFLDLAAYSIICEDNAGQYYPDYAYEHPLFTRHMKIYSDSSVSDFINSMSRNQSIEFLNEWNASHNHKDRIYISYDATNKNCSAGDIDLVEFGHPKDDKGKPVVNYAMSYTDVDTDAWYAEAVRWATAQGIMSGYGYNKFGPNDDMTREQLVTIMYRYAQMKKVDVSIGEDTNILSYDDAFDVSEWAVPAMQWAVGAGIVNGTSASTLSPKNNASRAEIATIVMRYCEQNAK